MENTLESKVADTVLQRMTEVKVDGGVYKVAQPTVATLIMASEAIAKLPAERLDTDNIAAEAVAVAERCRPIGDVAAILILGAKECVEHPPVYERVRARGWRGWLGMTQDVVVRPAYNPKDELSRKLLENYSPSRLHTLIASLLATMDLADFFALTTFLTEMNLLRPTRKVETKATRSGR